VAQPPAGRLQVATMAAILLIGWNLNRTHFNFNKCSGIDVRLLYTQICCLKTNHTAQFY
jgi:hypothetical protein